jgi:hypothetical protein
VFWFEEQQCADEGAKHEQNNHHPCQLERLQQGLQLLAAVEAARQSAGGKLLSAVE